MRLYLDLKTVSVCLNLSIFCLQQVTKNMQSLQTVFDIYKFHVEKKSTIKKWKIFIKGGERTQGGRKGEVKIQYFWETKKSALRTGTTEKNPDVSVCLLHQWLR